MGSLKKNKKNILFWGSQRSIDAFVIPLADHLTEYNIILLTHDIYHNNEWKNKNNEINSNYTIINITEEKINYLENIFIDLNPSCLIIINYKSIMNYIVNYVAQRNGIITIFMQHGVFDENIEELKKTKIFNSLSKYAIYIKYYFKYVKQKKIKILYNIMIKRNYRDDFNIDYALVYGEKDYRFINDNFNINRNNIFVSGYPIFKTEEESNLFSGNTNTEIIRKKVLFLHQPIFKSISNHSFKTEEIYFDKLNNICKKYDYDFKVKLHPQHNINMYSEAYQSILLKDVNLLTLIKDASIIVGFNSTALFYAVVLNKPIIQIFYPGYEYNLLNFREISRKVNSFNDFEVLLNGNSFESDKRLYNNFIYDNIGYNYSFEHISNELQNILKNNEK